MKSIATIRRKLLDFVGKIALQFSDLLISYDTTYPFQSLSQNKRNHQLKRKYNWLKKSNILEEIIRFINCKSVAARYEEIENKLLSWITGNAGKLDFLVKIFSEICVVQNVLSRSIDSWF